jgi:hypothetical protein
MTEQPRTGPQRKADTLSKLEAVNGDVWVATASNAGAAHLVPLSYAWHGERVVLAAEADSVTVRNVRGSGRARLGFGPTRDVVIIDAALDGIVGVADGAATEVADAYARQTDWDPSLDPGSLVFVLLRALRVQAWRESNELSGKLLMRDGNWLF